MSDRLIRESEVSEILKSLGSGFPSDVADIIKQEGRRSVHNNVVSSQFDADRLDYMRRDRLMSGSQHAGIDFDWLIANLKLANVNVGVDDAQIGQVETFVIGSKAILAAEAFVLGLFHLYPAVYFHKATRGAEKIFTELLVRIVSLVRDGDEKATGLPNRHPLIRFAKTPDDLDTALNLDDSVIWGSLGLLAEANDVLIAEYSSRLRDRKLLKAIDVRAQVIHGLDPGSRSEPDLFERVDRCCAAIHEKLTNWSKDQEGRESCLLVDEAERSPYKTSIDSSGFTKQINVLTDGGVPVDIKQRSSVVAALSTFKLLRVYVRPDDASAREFVERTIKGEIDKCP